MSDRSPGPRRRALLAAEIERLLKQSHPDPHSILGAHATPGGIVVRALRPGASEAKLLPDAGKPVAMKAIAPGLFEQTVKRNDVFPYRIEARYPDGRSAVARDAYAFLPTLGDVDLHLFGEGRHERLHEKLGAHVRTLDDTTGVSFAVWAPNARGVSVVGGFNGWDGRCHMMRRMGSSGVWELFVPGVSPGALYKFEIGSPRGARTLKTDPMARAMEAPPAQASVVWEPGWRFSDEAWMAARRAADPWRGPLSIYEVHLGSWRRGQGNQPPSYREIAAPLCDYVQQMGFTHVEFMPLQEHPLTLSWGYQVSGYFAPTARFGTPDDLRFLIDSLHRRGVGVIIDWVPAHFPKDEFALGRFDGTALYEHLDPRQGEHPDWGTYVFNYGRNEVRNFLLASALYWLEEMHVDGLRVDAVASMLYLDYSRPEGGWVPNPQGGRENLEAIAFIRELNQVVHRRNPGVLMIAEESTAWPAVSRPTHLGGLGFGFKWNMGWMHDTLAYFSKDPVHRRHHHRNLTFGMLYAWTENFVLPLSHDEVVHGKRALIHKMPGDRAAKFANLRALFGYMWAQPGKKMLFMGGELGQPDEWECERSVPWHLLEEREHAGLQRLVRDLNRLYREEPALWEADVDSAGFLWIAPDEADANVVAFVRIAPRSGRRIVCVGNFSPVIRKAYRIGLPAPGRYAEVLDTDAAIYGGSNVGNGGAVTADPVPCHGLPCSARVVLPPLAVLWFAVPQAERS